MPKSKSDFTTEFNRRCQACQHKPDGNGSCKFSGQILTSVQFEVKQYFKLAFAENVSIPCPVFVDLKKAFDTHIKQAPVIEVLDKYKTGTGPEFLE